MRRLYFSEIVLAGPARPVLEGDRVYTHWGNRSSDLKLYEAAVRVRVEQMIRHALPPPGKTQHIQYVVPKPVSISHRTITTDELKGLLTPYAKKPMTEEVVSTLVNSPKNEGPEILVA